MALKYNTNDIAKIYLESSEISKCVLGNSYTIFENEQSAGIATLLSGTNFYQKISSKVGSCTSIIFTKKAIPTNVSSYVTVSASNSDFAAYAYTNGSTLYIAPEIDNVSFLAIDCSNMFLSLNVQTIDLTPVDTSQVSNMASMFDSCSNLKTIIAPNFSTKSLSTCYYMFYACSNLSFTFTIENTNISQYRDMFYGSAINSGANIVLNYINGCGDMAQTLVNTKSAASKVYIGSQI